MPLETMINMNLDENEDRGGHMSTRNNSSSNFRFSNNLEIEKF